jgi:hypothetical protein
MPRSTLRRTPLDAPRKIRGQDGVAVSFPVRLLHSSCIPVTMSVIAEDSNWSILIICGRRADRLGGLRTAMEKKWRGRRIRSISGSLKYLPLLSDQSNRRTPSASSRRIDPTQTATVFQNELQSCQIVMPAQGRGVLGTPSGRKSSFSAECARNLMRTRRPSSE